MAFPAALSAQVVATQLEQVNPKLPKYLVAESSNFAKLFDKASPKHKVSAWNAGSGAVLAYRVPVLLNRGGDYQVISLDNGDLGSGSMMTTAYMTLGAFATDIAYAVPMQAAMSTKSNAQAITNVLEDSITNGIKESAIYDEIGLFQDSTGILAMGSGTGSAPSGGSAGSSVTYNLETLAFSYIRIRGNNTLLDVYGSNNVIKQTGVRVTNINYSQNQVTVLVPSGGSYTPANNDQLAYPNMSLGAGGYTTTSGSFRNGIYTFQTTNTTGSLLGLTYSSAYELVCNVVNGGGGYYTPSLLFSGKSQLTQRRDDKVLSGIKGVCHTAQRTSWYLQAVTIANQFLRPGEASKPNDLAGQGTMLSDTFEAGDVIHHVSRYANKSRVDWFDPKNFGWVQWDEPAFVTTPEGQRIFIGHNTTTGNPTAGFQFYMHNTRNLYSVDPGCSVITNNLQIPAGQ